MPILCRFVHECVLSTGQLKLFASMAEFGDYVGIHHHQNLGSFALVLVGKSTEEAEGSGYTERGSGVAGANSFFEANIDCSRDWLYGSNIGVNG